jgi:hypothetical protein
MSICSMSLTLLLLIFSALIHPLRLISFSETTSNDNLINKSMINHQYVASIKIDFFIKKTEYLSHLCKAL